MTKFCKDCKWCKAIIFDGDDFSKCRNPKNQKERVTSPEKSTQEIAAEFLVTGRLEIVEEHIPRIIRGWRCDYCSNHRRYGWFDSLLLTRCGKRGRWFEAKEDA